MQLRQEKLHIYNIGVKYMNIGIDIDDTITKTSEETDIWAKE